MKIHIFKSYCIPAFIFLMLLTLTMGCKKDQLVVNEEKVYSEVGVGSNPSSLGGWGLSLRPDGTADIVPGGDIAYRGTYNINGASIKVKTEQNSQTYTFKIISNTEIKEAKYGTVLKLRQ